MDEQQDDTFTYEYTFTAIEIDLDYEFDAARYFDFGREETPAEAREAQRWFESAASYPPSPFVSKLSPNVELLLENVTTSPKPRDADDTSKSHRESDVDVDVDEGISVADIKNDEKGRETSINVHASRIKKLQSQNEKIHSGSTFYNHTINNNFRTEKKSARKPSFPRSSTLMKPTATQLAKQHKSHQQKGGSRSHKPLADKNKKGSGNHCVIEVQAAKRQKLEGGHLRKVAEIVDQINIVHKEPKKDAACDINTMEGKLRITFPQEPYLETAHRAQKLRGQKTNKEADSSISAIPKFKARPLNKKILEAPSLLLPKRSTPRLAEFHEFHLRTLERAKQHTLATSSSTVPHSNSHEVPRPSATSTVECGKKEPRRPNLLDTLKQEGLDISQNFRGCLLDKKIFASKGGLGVFQNTKREATVPMEFNFQTSNGGQHNPPIELFNKLSLASEPQPNAGSQLKLTRSAGLPGKGSKENNWGYLPDYEIAVGGQEAFAGSKMGQTRASLADTGFDYMPFHEVGF